MPPREKVTQQKEKDFDMVEPQVGFTDMTDENQDIVYDTCREAYSKY